MFHFHVSHNMFERMFHFQAWKWDGMKWQWDDDPLMFFGVETTDVSRDFLQHPLRAQGLR